MSRFAEYTTAARTQTVYFAYGSNLHLAQMAARCPESRYLGLGILENYKWQINTRGFANVIQSPGDKVEGLCYLLSKKDERSLDRSEGVPRAYEKLYLPVDVFSANALISGRRVGEVNDRIQWEIRQLRDSHRREQTPYHARNRNACFKIIPEYHPNTGVALQALVYVNSVVISDGIPREEYKTRIRAGVEDAIALGIPHRYFDRNFEEPMNRSYVETRRRDGEDRYLGETAANPHLSGSADDEMSYEIQGSTHRSYLDSRKASLEGPRGSQEPGQGPRGGSSSRARKSNRGERGTGERRGTAERKYSREGRHTNPGEITGFARMIRVFGEYLGGGAASYSPYRSLSQTLLVTPLMGHQISANGMEWWQEGRKGHGRRR